MARRHTAARSRSARVHADALLEHLEVRQLLAADFDLNFDPSLQLVRPPTVINPDGPVIARPDANPTSIVTADINDDGNVDVLMSVGRNILWKEGRGNGRFRPLAVLASFNTPAGLLATGDFDGDGQVDIFSAQTNAYNGWARTLINTGNGTFNLVRNRIRTVVEQVLVGNLDADVHDEVIIKGRTASPVIASIFPFENDELRVLDPSPTGTQLPPPNVVIMRDKGVLLTGARMTVGVGRLQNLVADSIIVGVRSDTNTLQSTVTVYSYNAAVNFVPFQDVLLRPRTSQLPTPEATLDASGPAIVVDGRVSSIAVGDTHGSAHNEVVVSTLVEPVVPIPFLGVVPNGNFEALTRSYQATTTTGQVILSNEVTVDARTLAGRPNARRTIVPEYRVETISDINDDGRADVGIAVVQDFTGPNGGAIRHQQFVQATQFIAFDHTLNIPGAGFTSHFVYSQVFRGGAVTQFPPRGANFVAADLRDLGRIDLIIAEPLSNAGGPVVKVHYNSTSSPFLRVPLVPQPNLTLIPSLS